MLKKTRKPEPLSGQIHLVGNWNVCFAMPSAETGNYLIGILPPPLSPQLEWKVENLWEGSL